MNGMLANQINQCPNSVSVHFRYSDFVELGWTLTSNYYRKAMHLIEQLSPQPHFFIFSDDMQRVRQQFSAVSNVTFVEHNSPQQGQEDFRLMSLCKHHIICKSSFSWWAALLSESANKIVIHPGTLPSPSEWIVLQDN